MAKSNAHETKYLKLTYQNIDATLIGDAGGLRGSVTPNSFWAALYVTDPTDADTGTEATYGGYAREAVVRSAVGWTVTGADVTNAGIIQFNISTGTSNTITHVGIHTAITGGELIHHGQLATPILVELDDIPKFEIGDFKVTEN